MAPSTTLAFRPRHDHQTKRDDSPAPVAVSFNNLAFRPPPASNNSHVSHTHRRPNATAGPINDETLTVENLSLNMSVAQRVARRRRRVAVDPFIPKKGVVKRTVALKPQRPRQAPVFGVASLMDTDTYNLVVALGTKPPGTKIVDLSDLPAQVRDPQDTVVHVNHHEKLNRGYVDGEGFNEVVVTEKSHCVEICQGLSEDQGGLVPCVYCNRAYHPVCVGKGRHSHADYTVSQHLDDVRYYLKKGGFSCPSCDDKALAAKNPAKEHFNLSSNELGDEKKRRLLVFAARNAPRVDETEPAECDNCEKPIIAGTRQAGTRYECRYCPAFDLCRKCYIDPIITSSHQHVFGDRKWHTH